MPESKKSPPNNGEWYEKALNDQIVKNENQILEERIAVLQSEIDALKEMAHPKPTGKTQQRNEDRLTALEQKPIGKIMYRPPGGTKHLELADYLNEVETRLNTMELRIELDV